MFASLQPSQVRKFAITNKNSQQQTGRDCEIYTVTNAFYILSATDVFQNWWKYNESALS